MTGFDTAAELRVGLSDVAGTREFLRRFARAWDLPDGCDALERFEARLEVALPVALRETYGLGGVLDPGALEVQDNVLVFHCADPMIAESMWGIPLDVVGQPDPPVVINTGDGVWQPYLDRVSLACVDLALTAVIQEHDERLCNACELPAEMVGSAMAPFDRMPLPDLPMWIDVEESPVRWWSRPGQLLRTHGEGGVWLWVSAQTKDDLNAVYAAIPYAEWSN
jgi:hypothetical protein